jgi:16S rRNA (guanine527-N7)-methyltransferase
MSGDSQQALEAFVALLLRWNSSINLVGRGDIPLLWRRHVADSLQLGSLCGPLPQRAIDLGSGAGFPGLILAIRFGLPVALIEEDQRKAAFLREAIRITRAPAHVHATRIEAAPLAPAPLVTARALAPLPKLLALAAPLLAPNGTCLFLKGANVRTELTDAATGWHMRAENIPSRTSPGACILRITDLARVAHPP